MPTSITLRVIHREKRLWLRTTPGSDYFTPYDRFKSVWFDTAPTAFNESSRIGHGFRSDGTTVIVDAAGESHSINLSDIGVEARRIISKVESSILQWLPHDAAHVFSDFHLTQLSDDLGNQKSIFRQRENAELLQSKQNTIKELLFCSFGDKEEDIYRWLQGNDRLLFLFMASIVITCGIPPRAFQFASFQFDQCYKTGAGRGLFLIDGCLAIGKPVAKQSGKSRQECLWFLPPLLSSSLVFYLGILRPIVINCLTVLRKDVTHQHTLIFCRTVPKTGGSHSWNGEELNCQLKLHTSNLAVALSVGVVRQLYTAFFRQYFPGLCDAGPQEDALVDRQSQHRFYTGKRHYGQVVGNVPQSLGIDLTEARKLGAISQLLHIVFGLAPPNEDWRALLEDSHFLPITRNDLHALCIARLQVLLEYNIMDRGRGPVAALRVRELLRTQPYAALVGFSSHQRATLTSYPAHKTWLDLWRYGARTSPPCDFVWAGWSWPIRQNTSRGLPCG